MGVFYLGRRGCYRPPNGGSVSLEGDVRRLFDDSRVAWPRRAHWWRYVEEDESFALWVLNTAAGSPSTAFEHGKVLGRFLDRMGWGLGDLMRLAVEDRLGLERLLD